MEFNKEKIEYLKYLLDILNEKKDKRSHRVRDFIYNFNIVTDNDINNLFNECKKSYTGILSIKQYSRDQKILKLLE